MQKISGIYCIENIDNNKKYIGQSVDIHSRWKSHRKQLRNNWHPNIHLQSSWNFYGEDRFSFSVLEECEIELLDKKEKHYVRLYNSDEENFGYNYLIGGGKSGWRMPEDMKIHLSEMNKGKSPTNKGVPFTPEQRERYLLASSLKGPVTQLAKDNMSKAHKNSSEEAKRKRTDALRGIKWEKATSKYRGVSWDKNRNKWFARIYVNKKVIVLGRYEYEVEAAMTYNEASLEFFGFRAILNEIPQSEIDNLWNLE